MPELNLETARAMTDAAFKHARANNWIISVVVLDAGGHLVHACRMDGCNFLAPDIARGKAMGAAAWKEPSDNFAKRLADNPAWAAGMIAASGGRFVPIRGALPIWSGGRCVGAIGASGVRANQDEECCRAGLTAAGFTEAP